tara:strand:- start:2598 stop:8597 length:6000 start_codon:yes stop_codon:yes gene_type:complete
MAEKDIPVISQLKSVVGINKKDPTIDGGLQIIGSGTIGTNHLSSSHLLIGTDDNGMGLDQNEIRTAGTNLHLGTLSSHYIVFTTNKTNRMNVSSGGNVNIGDGNVAATEKLQLTGNFKIVGNNSAFSNFTSGLVGGAGWKINYDGSNSNLEVDNVLVRNTLQTHIFQKDVVKAANGYLYISDSGVIASASLGNNKITFNSSSATFDNNDLLWFKDADPDSGNIVSVKFRINDSSPDLDGSGNATYDVDEITGSLSDLVIGGTAVRISGGSLLLDASSPNSPFMDVINNNTTYVRTGKLDGITSNNLGSLSGFGFWASGSAYLEGSINATGGTIGGWVIGQNTIASIDTGNSNITMSSANGGYLSIGDLEGHNDFNDDSEKGIYMSSTGDVLMKQSNSEYLQLTGGTLMMRASEFKLDTPNLDIDSTAKTITVGSSVIISGSANSNAGQIKVGSNVILNGDDTSTISGWYIGSGEIQKTGSSSTDGIVIDSGNKAIQLLGASGGVTAYSRANTRVLVGQVSTGEYGIKGWDDSGNRIFELSEAQNEIAGWTFTDERLKKADANGGISIDSNAKRINALTGSNEDTYRVRFGQLDANEYGIQGRDASGNEIFNLGEQGNSIAGWTFTDTMLSKANKIYLNSATDHGQMWFSSSGYSTAAIGFDGSGAGKLAGGNITWDSSGNTTIQGAVTIANDVTVNADVSIGSLPVMPPDEKLKGHWSFDSPNNLYMDVSGNGNDGVHLGTAFEFISQSGIVGGCVLTKEDGGVQLLNDADVNSEYYQSYCGWFKPAGYPADSGDGSEARLLSRDWSAYWAWMEEDSYDSNGQAYLEIGRSASHINFANGLTSGSWHFIAMTLDYDTNAGKGYLYKPDGTLVTGSFSPGTNPAIDPDGSDGGTENVNGVNLACNSDDDNISGQEANDNWSGSIDEVRYYNKVLTDNEIDALYLNPSGPRKTTISGDEISTGKIQSNNWPTYGSEFDLTAGTIKLGGSSPKFEVDASGNVSASGEIHISGSGKIAGWDIKGNYIGKQNSPTNYYTFLAADATAIATDYHDNMPVLSFYNSVSKMMINIGNIYKNKTNMGFALFSDYANDVKVFEVSENNADPGTLQAQIAGWTFNNEKIYKSGIDIHSGNSTIQVNNGSFYVNLGQTLTDAGALSGHYGISARNGSSDVTYFRLDSNERSIAGWNFNNWKITSPNIEAAYNNTQEGLGLIIASTGSGAGNAVYTGGQTLAGISSVWHRQGNAGHLVFGQLTNVDTNQPSVKTGYRGIQMAGWAGSGTPMKEYFALAAQTDIGTDVGLTDGGIYNRIAGWKFDENKLIKNNIEINSSTEMIKLGTVSDFTNDDSSNKGVLMSGSGEFFVGKEDTEYLYWDGTNLHLKSTDVNIEVSDLNITASQIDMTTTQFNLNANSGDLLLDSTEHKISLANDNIVLDGTSTGFMSIGNVTGVTDTTGDNKGFYAEGDGDFITKAGANQYIQFNGGNLDIKTNKFELDVSDDLQISSTHKSMSLGTAGGGGIRLEGTSSYGSFKAGAVQFTEDLGANAGIYFDGSGQGIIKASGTQYLQFLSGDMTIAAIKASLKGQDIEISGSNFHLLQGDVTASNVDLSGKITAQTGTIGGFDIGTDLDATSGTLKLKGASGQLTASAAKITGDITANTGQIGGWNISDTQISSGNIKLDTVSDSGRIVVGTLTGDSPSTTNYGLLAKDDGTVLIKGDDNNTNYLKFDPDAGDSVLSIKTPNFQLFGGNITASNVDLTGKIIATSGQFSGDVIATHINTTSGSIGGWTLNPSYIGVTGAQLSKNGYLSINSKSALMNSTQGAFFGKNNNDYGIAVGDTATAGGGFIAMSGDSYDSFVVIGNFVSASNRTDDSNWIYYNPSLDHQLQIRTDRFKILNGVLSVSGSGHFFGKLTANDGDIAGWQINSGSLSAGSVGITTSSIDIDSDTGVVGVKSDRVLHSMQTSVGEFAFGAIIYTPGPGEGGYTYAENNAENINSQGGVPPEQQASP